MKILHISDIHYDHKREDLFNKVFDELYRTVNSLDEKIDLIVFSGDLVNQYGSGEFNEEMNKASRYIYDFCKKTRISIDNFVMCIGNHEVNKKLFTMETHNGLKAKYHSQIGDISRSITECFYEYEHNNIISDVFKPVEQYLDYVKSTFDSKNITYYSPLVTIYKYRIDGKRVGVASFNNVWSCGLFDRDPLYGNLVFGIDQIRKALEQMNDCYFKIGNAHSSINHIHEVERSKVEDMIISKFDMFMTGHTHYNDTLLQSKSEGAKFVECLFTSSPSFNVENYYDDSNKYIVGFNIIDIDEFRDVKIVHKILKNRDGSFINDTSITETGESYYDIDRDKQNGTLKIRDVFHMKKRKFNDTLISSVIDPDVPSSIDSIFAEPTLILESTDGYEDKRIVNTKRISLTDYLFTNDECAIFGTQESGKSTILYKIYSDILSNSLETSVYPLYVNINGNKGKHDFNKLMSMEFDNIKMKNLLSFLSNKEIVLLIDNLDYNDDNIINGINEFRENNNVVKIIFTASLMLSGEIPLSYFRSKVFEYCAVSIKPMTIENIEAYSNKWGNVFDTKDESINKIINFAKEKHIPTYPIYLSMLLWLSETKKNMDTFSNALLIQNFTEKLLQKHNHAQNIYEQFSYLDYVELLVNIAEYFEENEFVSITETALHNRVATFLMDNNLDKSFNEPEITDYLLKSGVFTLYCENSICFRYDCIYNYFLAQGLMEDDEKLEELLSSDKLFKYVDVLDIYTTLKKNTTKVDDKLVELLLEELTYVQNEIGLDLKSIDKFYHREFAISPLFNTEGFEEEQKKVVKENEKNITNKQLIEVESYQKESLEQKHTEISRFEKLERIIILVSNIIRNSNSFRRREDIVEQLDNVFSAAVYFMFIYNRSNILQLLENNLEGEEDSRLPFIIMSILFSPAVMQMFIQNNMGSVKIKGILTDYYGNHPDMESRTKEFLLWFMMLENDCIAANDFKEFIKNENEHFIIDNIYMRLTSMYFFDDEREKEFLDYISHLKKKNRNWKGKEALVKELEMLKGKKQRMKLETDK